MIYQSLPRDPTTSTWHGTGSTWLVETKCRAEMNNDGAAAAAAAAALRCTDSQQHPSNSQQTRLYNRAAYWMMWQCGYTAKACRWKHIIILIDTDFSLFFFSLEHTHLDCFRFQSRILFPFSSWQRERGEKKAPSRCLPPSGCSDQGTDRESRINKYRYFLINKASIGDRLPSRCKRGAEGGMNRLLFSFFAPFILKFSHREQGQNKGFWSHPPQSRSRQALFPGWLTKTGSTGQFRFHDTRWRHCAFTYQAACGFLHCGEGH